MCETREVIVNVICVKGVSNARRTAEVRRVATINMTDRNGEWT